MFGWFRKKPDLGDVYCYWDGREWVRGDPMAILRRLSTDDSFNFSVLAKLSCAPDQMGMVSSGQLIDGIRKAFELPSVRDGGLTEIKAARLMLDFQRWLADVKKNTPPLPSDAPPIPDSPADNSPVENCSASTSTPTESSAETLSPLPSGSTSLSGA